ncbi:MAG: RluA family pseudouridine synthase [Planctomycetaceae bacterium]
MHDELAPAPVVVHADDDLVVVDKPGGVPSVPARTPLDPPDVAARLRAAYGVVEAVHRLDRDTSGLLVLARHRAARIALGRAFEAAAVAKVYLAVVAGPLPAASGELSLPLAADRDRPPRQRVDPILGRRATSRWRVLAAAEGTSLVELEPVTGRSHQLRVHLAWLGCPVLMDPLYGDASAARRGGLALRAMRLVLPHPRDGRALAIEAAWPCGGAWEAFDRRAWGPAAVGTA